MFKAENHVPDSLRQRVEDELFREAAVKLNWTRPAQRIDEQGNIVLGCRLAGITKLSNLAHELGHFVEIDEGRMGQPGWGLTYPQVEIGGRKYDSPQSYKGLLRECRVLAFQANILTYFGAFDEGDHKSWADSLSFLPDYINAPGPIAKSKTPWILRQIDELRAVHTLDLFMSEWSRRNQILKARVTSEYHAP